MRLNSHQRNLYIGILPKGAAADCIDSGVDRLAADDAVAVTVAASLLLAFNLGIFGGAVDALG